MLVLACGTGSLLPTIKHRCSLLQLPSGTVSSSSCVPGGQLQGSTQLGEGHRRGLAKMRETSIAPRGQIFQGEPSSSAAHAASTAQPALQLGRALPGCKANRYGAAPSPLHPHTPVLLCSKHRAGSEQTASLGGCLLFLCVSAISLQAFPCAAKSSGLAPFGVTPRLRPQLPAPWA